MQARVYRKLGLLLIFASCGMWVAILAAPILPGSIAQKAMLTGSLVIFSEVIFWLGIMLAGKELAHRYRQKLNPRYWWQKVNQKDTNK
jgi:putative effector of murein hydrolase LrgA (UPF0299 family)